jgi:uncharacterized protein (DUF2062 family)
MNWRERLRQVIPTRQQILANRWLRWLAPWLDHPALWHWSRRGVALGVAIGIFFGLLIPIAQIPISAVVAVLLRANLPAAAASTLVTNPVTFAPVYIAAYYVGAWITGEEVTPEAVEHAAPPDGDISLWAQIIGLGRPLLVGLCVFAVSGGLLTYLLINLIWIWRIRSRRRQQLTQRRRHGSD